MATRDELVRVGVELLEAEGLAALSLRRIAAAAGVSHGAPRHHFPAYDALLAAIARQGVEDLDAVLRPALDPAPMSPGQDVDPADAARASIAAAARSYVDFAQSRPEMFELIHRHDLLDGRGGNLRELTAPWFEALATHVARATGDADPHCAAALWAGVHGLAVLTSRRTTEPVSPGLDSGRTLDCLVDGLLTSWRAP